MSLPPAWCRPAMSRSPPQKSDRRETARQGKMPIQLSNGGRPVSPDVSLTNKPVRATIVTATKDRRHDPTVHGLPGLMAQIVSQPTDDAEHADDR